MTKQLLIVDLSELGILRLVCTRAGCGTAIEVRLSHATDELDSAQCPTCKRKIAMGYAPGDAPLRTLLKAIENLRALQTNFAVQFIIDEHAGDA